MAAGQGIEMPNDAFDSVKARLEASSPNATSSMQRDLMEGRPSELEAQLGAVVRLAEAAELDLPIILVARSTLGTINHTLLSIEAIRRRGLPLAGVVIIGPETPHNRAAIERYGQIDVIAEIPWLDTPSRSALRDIQPELDLLKLATVSL